MSAVNHTLTQIPLSLYIHFPWCVRKCPYCDFNSHQVRESFPEKEYIDQLIVDLECDLPRIGDRQIISIFMGGGTPSLFSPEAIDRLLNAISKRLSLEKNCEITMEANPGTVDQARFSEFRKCGINRLSIGVQSFQSDKLNSLGRIHDGTAAENAAIAAKKAGFENFNLDLMHGLPKQTLNDAMEDLDKAISLNPTHISWYQLTIEPNTFFYKKPPVLPNDELTDAIQTHGQEKLSAAGYGQYEISAYSKANRMCIHNKNYWEFGDYLGIGAGAHSKITDFQKKTIIRTSKIKNPKDYLKASRTLIGEEKTIEEKELSFEFMLNALRLTDGVPRDLLETRTGLTWDGIAKEISIAEQKGLLETRGGILRPTTLGLRFLNDLITIFLPP